jgi:hypothetical protein
MKNEVINEVTSLLDSLPLLPKIRHYILYHVFCVFIYFGKVYCKIFTKFCKFEKKI